MDDTEWRDWQNDDKPVWSQQIVVYALNNGWRDGAIAGVELEERVREWMPDRVAELLG